MFNLKTIFVDYLSIVLDIYKVNTLWSIIIWQKQKHGSQINCEKCHTKLLKTQIIILKSG
jgi:hypothetical protein